MEPDAPGWLTMTTFWPSAFSISAAVTRVTWSVEPPAAHGTMIVMGFVGFQVACADAGTGEATRRRPAAASQASCGMISLQLRMTVFRPFVGRLWLTSWLIRIAPRCRRKSRHAAR